jgi:hypothetical protein
MTVSPCCSPVASSARVGAQIQRQAQPNAGRRLTLPACLAAMWLRPRVKYRLFCLLPRRPPPPLAPMLSPAQVAGGALAVQTEMVDLLSADPQELVATVGRSAGVVCGPFEAMWGRVGPVGRAKDPPAHGRVQPRKIACPAQPLCPGAGADEPPFNLCRGQGQPGGAEQCHEARHQGQL